MTKEELDFFDKIAPKWDSMEVKSTPAKVKEILHIIGIKKGDHVADIGCGTGVLIPGLSELVGENGVVVGIDFSTEMLKVAKEKCKDLKNVRFLRADIEEDSIDEKFDVIILYCVYPHLSEPELTLKILAGLNLKPGGKIIIAFPSDERFINNIHHSREVEDGLDSELLPSAPKLASFLSDHGLPASVMAYSPAEYIVAIYPE